MSSTSSAASSASHQSDDAKRHEDDDAQMSAILQQVKDTLVQNQVDVNDQSDEKINIMDHLDIQKLSLGKAQK
jgi:hypothetical protein